ncbi:MAG: 50S ribosomal protein L10 [Bacteroidota bacterium]|nr:50S ribosomal protein L10 [Bacteroidota bacterium]
MKTREDKNKQIDILADEINRFDHFYLTNTQGLDAEETTDLRKQCYEKEVKLTMVKNTLFKRALDKADGDFEELYDLLKSNITVMFSNTANAPGKVIKTFIKNHDKPSLKGAYAAENFYLGEDQLEALAGLKSKEEILGDIVLLLQSPAKNVVSQLQSAGQIIAGLTKALADREE